MQSEFSVRILPSVDGTAQIRVAGEVDICVAAPLGDALVRAVTSRGVRRVVVDLGAVTFLDASGIGVLLGAHGLASGRGCRLQVRGARGFILDVQRLSGAVPALTGT